MDSPVRLVRSSIQSITDYSASQLIILLPAEVISCRQSDYQSIREVLYTMDACTVALLFRGADGPNCKDIMNGIAFSMPSCLCQDTAVFLVVFCFEYSLSSCPVDKQYCILYNIIYCNITYCYHSSVFITRILISYIISHIQRYQTQCSE